MKIVELEQLISNTRADGIIMTEFFSGEKGKENVTMGIAAFPPGAVVPWAAHDADEYSYVLEGELSCETREKGKKTMQAGFATLIPAGEEHSSSNESNGEAKVLWVLVKLN